MERSFGRRGGWGASALGGEMEVSVNVWGSPEVPDEVGALDLPDVPDSIGADVEITSVAGDEEGGENVFFFDGFDGCVDVIRTETREHASHGFKKGALLVLGEGCDGESWEVCGAGNNHAGGFFGSRFGVD